MKNVMQDHPRLTTAAVIAIAVIVVVSLYLLSIQAPAPSSSDSVIAHGRQGPVATGGGAGEDGGSPQSDTLSGVREIDFRSVLAEEIDSGQSLENVIFVDIDGNGSEEAVALLRGKGESRPLAWRLYGYRNGRTEPLYERSNVAQGELQVQGVRLIESEGVFGEGDQPCCPSSIKVTYYVWKGDGLVVSKVEAAPPAP